MAPTPQENLQTPEFLWQSKNISEQILEDDSIVISGMSGMYPAANNVKELSEILYNKKNPISNTTSRWNYKHPELSTYSGAAPGVDLFDAQFFTVNYRLGAHMDPMSRKLLQHTYQAIYDAGLNIGQLNGKKVAVFIGSSFSDNDANGFFNCTSHIGLGIVGASKTMFANRISYWLNVKGPSLSIDESDSSSTTALKEALSAMQRGDCEAAIVGGSQLCLCPQAVIHHERYGAVSKDGKIKSYAENASGYVLSDAINVLFLQKAKDALRIYAQVLHVKTEHLSGINNEVKNQLRYERNFEKYVHFINEFYNEAKVLPQLVEYVEGCGRGMPTVDKTELEAIAAVYCKDRSDPLLVGSITSNIGLTGPSSGISGITKVLLGYHKGELAANLNCEEPQKGILALRDGRMRIVTEHQPFRRTYTAINGISTSGGNSHILLCGHYKPKDFSRYTTSIPYLITLSGRQDLSVKSIIEELESHPIDPEEIALIHNIYSKNISGHLGRGYFILDTDENNKTLKLVEKTEYFNSNQRLLWFVYSGMGSQWAGMGADLMRIPIFASAIARCQRVLAPKGLDIVDIICSPNKQIFDNILHSFVGIAAIQIGLTDILKALGLVPDGIIGHSVGELGCAYADGCLTAEEMILAAYSRGRVSLETLLIHGSMAAVGLSYQEISKICPPEIDVACHNSSTSCTISGPADVMRNFVNQLSAQGVFAKEVPCSNIAYHSRYIADAGPSLLKYLKQVIKDPKPRSERWLSTSVPQNKWHESAAKYCSAEYHTNNLLNPVLFEETCRMIPKNAVLVEVAPYGLLQAILKRSMPVECRNVPLTRRSSSNNVQQLLQALGSIYLEGFALNLAALYPTVQFPVSTTTPMLSHLVEWVHSEKWAVNQMAIQHTNIAPVSNFVKSIHDIEHQFLRGHIIRKKLCYPFAAALKNVWDIFAMHAGYPKQGVSIRFQDVHLYAQPLLFEQKPLRINVSIHRGTGRFEVMGEHSRIASGIIMTKEESPADNYIQDFSEENKTVDLTSKDIYQLLNDRGYNYSGDFQSIEWANMCLNKAGLVWSGNWITFIDSMIQLNILRQQHHDVSLPIHIKSLTIDIEKHFKEQIYHLNGKNVMQAEVVHNFTRCGGVTLKYIQYQNLPQICAELQAMELSITPSKEKNNLQEINTKQELKPMSLQNLENGKITSLCWAQSPYIQKSNINVTVYYAGLNSYDVRKSSGVVSSDSNTYGMDYSGITKCGERVMGLVSTGAVSSQVDAQLELLWPVPKNWTLEDAATVPFAYAYAYYALVMKGNLEPGMNILIHEGTDAIGQAAIAIALAYKCQVFATVSDVRKRNFLRKLFPELQEDHIGNARDTSFAYAVFLGTRGKGCNIVIGGVKGELKDVSLNCCSSYGVLIDTVQIKDREDFEYGMYHMTKARSYLTIDLSSIFVSENQEDMKTLQKLLCDGLSAGYVVPLSRVTYELHDVEKAFKLLAKNQYYGRVLLHIPDNIIQAQQRLVCDPDQCQIIIWNNEVFGCQLAELLIRKGAKNLYICSTNLSPYQIFKIRAWQALGVQVQICIEEFTKDLLQIKVLNNALSLGDIEGIYVVLTALNTNATMNDFVTALGKLDLESRLQCQQLKHFVLMSTMKTLGDKLCSSRVKSGLPVTWLDLSNLSDGQIKATTSSDIANTIENAICSKNITSLAQIKPVEPLALSYQVLKLADISAAQISRMGMDITLHELGTADEKISLICTFLYTIYGLSLDECQVSHLTLQKLHELENYLTEFVPLNTKGISTFISKICPDEILATADLIEQKTLTHKVTNIENDFDITGKYLCIIPGIEGHHERFSLLCERLKTPAIVLQPGLDHPYETAKQTAQRYAMTLFKKTDMPDKFCILGYESGVMIALELAAILEDKGLTGTVFCLGIAPSEFKALVQDQLSDFITEEQLQNAVICHFYTLLCGEDAGELDTKLQTISSWPEKVNMCIRSLSGKMTKSVQFARALIEVTFARLIQARQDVVPVRPLHSRVILLRAASNFKPPSKATMQLLSNQPVVLHQLELPLSSVSKDMQCSTFINQYLDIDVLKAFENKNICESYLN